MYIENISNFFSYKVHIFRGGQKNLKQSSTFSFKCIWSSQNIYELYKSTKKLHTVKLQVLPRVYNMEINFLPKGHSK